jgi:hypothetical protein
VGGPIGSASEKALAGLHERGRGGDALGRQVVRGADLVEIAEPTPVVVGPGLGADHLPAIVDAVRRWDPIREGHIGDVSHAPDLRRSAG